MGSNVLKIGSNEDPVQHTAKLLAFFIIFIFFTALIGVGIASALNDNADWFNLFKDGFLILAGAITTIIGYYFGSRRTESIETDLKRTKNAKNKAIKEIKNLRGLAEGSDDLELNILPQYDIPDPHIDGIVPPKEVKK